MNHGTVGAAASRGPLTSALASRRSLVGAIALAVLAVYGLVGLELSVSSPILAQDSAGYIAQARRFAGIGATAPYALPYYSPGYGLLLAPGARAGLGIGALLNVGILVNAIAGSALFVALYRLLARFVQTSLALVASLAGALCPGTVLQVPFLWPEVVLAALFAWWTVAMAAAMATPRPEPWRWAAVLALGAAALATHQRMAVLLVVATAVGLWTMRGRQRLALLAGTVLSLLPLLLWDHFTRAELFEAKGNSVGDIVSDMGGPLVASTATTVGGSVWAVVISSAGIPVCVLLLLWRRSPERAVAAVVLAAGAGITILGALQLGAARLGGGNRSDFAAYYRYVGVVAPVLIAMGLGALLRERPSPAVRALPLLAVVVVGALWIAKNGGGTISGGFQYANGLGYFPLVHTGQVTSGAINVVLPSLIAAGVGLLVAAAAGRLPSGTVAGGLVLAGLVVVGLGTRQLDPYFRFWAKQDDPLVAVAGSIPRDEPLLLAPGVPVDTVNRILMAHPRLTVRRVASLAASPPSTAVLTSRQTAAPTSGRWAQIGVSDASTLWLHQP